MLLALCGWMRTLTSLVQASGPHVNGVPSPSAKCFNDSFTLVQELSARTSSHPWVRSCLSCFLQSGIELGCAAAPPRPQPPRQAKVPRARGSTREELEATLRKLPTSVCCEMPLHTQAAFHRGYAGDGSDAPAFLKVLRISQVYLIQ